MTLSEARKVLGEEEQNVSDEDLIKETEVTKLVKVIFFDLLKKNKL